MSGQSSSAMPVPVPGLVVRPRLIARLQAGVEGPVTLLSAPAGSGKTQLVLSWLNAGAPPGPVAWVSVDRDERDEMRFWGAVMRALRACGPPRAIPELQTLTPTPRATRQEFVRRLASGLAALRAPVVLVLDDLHELCAPEAVDGVAALLARRVPSLRVIVMARRDPAVGLHRLRVAGDVTEIRRADLDFTDAEASELLRTAGVDLAADGIRRLRARTEGWAAGLRLAALALAERSDHDRFLAQFSGSERTVADYLMREVLDGQPPAVRDLLLKTSVLEHVNGPLANLLAGQTDGQRVLLELEDANAFVESADVSRTWFRYHRLLADFLLGELARRAPQDIAGLHRAAARWQAEHGDAVEAIRHAQAGHDWEYAADVLFEHWFTLVLDGQRVTLHALLTAFPPDVLRTDAALAALTAGDRLAHGSLHDADAYIALAERLAGSVPERRRRRVEVILAVVRLFLARTRGDFAAAVDMADAILKPAVGETWTDVVSNDELRALAMTNLGVVELWAGRLDDAELHLQQGLDLSERIGRPYVALACLGPLAETSLMLGRLPDAQHRARAAIALAERLACADTPPAGVAYSALGSVLLGEGRVAESQHWLERAERALHGLYDLEAAVVLGFRVGMLAMAQRRYAEADRRLLEVERTYVQMRAHHYLSRVITVNRIRARIRLGDTAAADDALARAGDWTRFPEWCTLAAELALARHEPRPALDALAPVLDGSAMLLHPTQEAEALLLEAVVRERLGQLEAADAALDRGLTLAERQGWYSCAVLVSGVERLLARRSGVRARHAAFVGEMFGRLAGARTEDDPLREALTPRERDVLRLLATNLSAAEIASELVLSVHTVKAHMRSIYGKFEVHRRSDAVDRARALRLFDGQAHAR